MKCPEHTNKTIKPDKTVVNAPMDIVAGAGCYVPCTGSANNEHATVRPAGKTPFELSTHERAILDEAKRILYDLMMRQSNPLGDAHAVTEFLVHHLGVRQREVFGVLYLDSTNRVIRQHDLFEGSVRQSAVYPREVARNALLHNATAVILYHNHPSLQSANPSQSDLTLTRQVVDAMATLGIDVLDHIIVSGTHSFSFEANNLMPRN